MHLGILSFLRRPARTWSPAKPSLAQEHRSDTGPQVLKRSVPDTNGATVPMASVGNLTLVSRLFESPTYAYTLILTKDWRPQLATATMRGPALDVFHHHEIGVAVGIWNEPCSARALPFVPPAERAALLQLPDGLQIPLVGYAPIGAQDMRHLEGRWLRDARRWTVNMTLPVSVQEDGIGVVRELLASLRYQS